MGSRIRVLGVVAASVRGGAEEAFAALLRGLDPQRFEVFIACDGTGPMYEEYRRLAIEVWSMNISSARHVSTIGRLARLIRTLNCDVVHTHLWNADVLGGIAARLTGVPVVATVHGAYFLPIGISGVRRVRRMGMSRIYRSIYYLFDTVVAASNYVAGDLLERPGIPAPASRLQVVHNGLDLGRLERMAGDRGPAVRTSQRRPRILTLANFFPIKGQEWLIRAVPGVAAQFPNVEFVMAGEGESLPALRRLATALGVERFISFPGSIDNPVAALLDSDLFVLPSISEGLSIALLEALAMGVPVLSTTGGGTPEVVRDGETGRLVPPADAPALGAAIIELLSDRAKAAGFAEAGRALVRRQFACERMVGEMSAIYTRLAETRHR